MEKQKQSDIKKFISSFFFFEDLSHWSGMDTNTNSKEQ